MSNDDNPWPKYGLMWILNHWDIEIVVFAIVVLILRLLGVGR